MKNVIYTRFTRLPLEAALSILKVGVLSEQMFENEFLKAKETAIDTESKVLSKCPSRKYPFGSSEFIPRN